MEKHMSLNQSYQNLIIGGAGRLGQAFYLALNRLDEQNTGLRMSSLMAIERSGIPKNFFSASSRKRIFWFSGQAKSRSSKEECDLDYVRLTIFLQNNMYNFDTSTEMYFPSSGGTVYGNNVFDAKEDSPLNPSNFYAEMKINCEKLLINTAESVGCKVNIFRIANMYGSKMESQKGGLIEQMINSAISKTPFNPIVAVNSKKQYGVFDDYASRLAQITLLLSNNSNIVNTRNIYSAYQYSIKDVANMIATHFSFENLIVDDFMNKKNLPTESVTLSTNYISENTKMNWQSLSQYLNVRYNKS
jgi:nucleoside-diphosphate-sugar epimerase